MSRGGWRGHWWDQAWALFGMLAATAGCGDQNNVLGTISPPLGSTEDAGTTDGYGEEGTHGEAGAGGADAESEADSGTRELLRVSVAADGTGQFTTVQDAVNATASSDATLVEIDIAPGTYKEKLRITQRGALSLVGSDPLTTTITYDDDSASAGSTTNSASTTITVDDFSAANITFANSTPLGGAQAVAIYLSGHRQQFDNCRFLSYQDTVYVKAGSQYFRDCYIAGDDDYILGAATAVFQSCTVYQAADGVAVTAPNTDPATPYGIVFFGGALTAASDVNAGEIALGRPWGPYGSTTYVGTSLGAHISAVGWVPMGDNDLTEARFSEYKTTGPGADPSMRAPTSRQLTDAEASSLTLSALLDGWIPTYSP